MVARWWLYTVEQQIFTNVTHPLTDLPTLRNTYGVNKKMIVHQNHNVTRSDNNKSYQTHTWHVTDILTPGHLSSPARVSVLTIQFWCPDTSHHQILTNLTVNTFQHQDLCWERLKWMPLLMEDGMMYKPILLREGYKAGGGWLGKDP